jgi:hypothetical protein
MGSAARKFILFVESSCFDAFHVSRDFDKANNNNNATTKQQQQQQQNNNNAAKTSWYS